MPLTLPTDDVEIIEIIDVASLVHPLNGVTNHPAAPESVETNQESISVMHLSVSEKVEHASTKQDWRRHGSGDEETPDNPERKHE